MFVLFSISAQIDNHFLCVSFTLLHVARCLATTNRSDGNEVEINK